ncbi:unnamed protein product, partial [Mesorhabditis spiculigera]
MVQLWQVERPELAFDYQNPKYRVFCNMVHSKPACFLVLLICLKMAAIYLISLVNGNYWSLAVILLPMQLIAGLILFIGLRAEKERPLFVFLFLTLLFIVIQLTLIVRYIWAAIDVNTEIGFGQRIRTELLEQHEDGDDYQHRRSVAIMRALLDTWFLICYLVSFYIVYKCRNYFLHLNGAKVAKQGTVEYHTPPKGSIA